ncbi:hypothetical protein PI124_g18398 [Phytophthora idaei]|nr:hypothetical protein PI125_g21554 [Phytophthora idaei]KAG3131547.1 hypothetical protein PI126_g20002 [Phytophthora idaei]KAG3236589.1 hypothetical protein PI124_g18398 [Phytophthora idaei]
MTPTQANTVQAFQKSTSLHLHPDLEQPDRRKSLGLLTDPPDRQESSGNLTLEPPGRRKSSGPLTLEPLDRRKSLSLLIPEPLDRQLSSGSLNRGSPGGTELSVMPAIPFDSDNMSHYVQKGQLRLSQTILARQDYI